MLSQNNSFCMDMTVLERQQARFKWLQQQYNIGDQHHDQESSLMPQFQGFFDHTPEGGQLVIDSNGLPRYGDFSLAGADHQYFVGNNKMNVFEAELMTRSMEIDHCLSRTSSFQMEVTDGGKMEAEELVIKAAGEDVALKEKIKTNLRSPSSNKRKAEIVAAEWKEKKIKGEGGVESTVKDKINTVSSAGLSKENQNTSTSQKTDYIHVRARRGQATDSHSIAERARREKISKKMKFLQDLVPGCNKITGRAGMLDEIINYVQSLQRQVEFLSMKLAVQNPRPEFNLDNFSKREFPAYLASFPAANISSSIDNLSQLQLNLVEQASTGSEPEMLKNPNQAEAERNANSSIFVPELCLDSSSYSQVQSDWDADLQTLHKYGI